MVAIAEKFNLPNALNPRQAGNALASILKANRLSIQRGGIPLVALLIGLPGTGKTSICKQVAKLLGYDGVIIVTPTTYNSFDLRGLPHVTADLKTVFAASNVLPTSGKWLIVVDELADCPLHEQSGFYQLFLERKLGEWNCPPESDIVGASNDDTMGACANPLSTALKTRCVIINVKGCAEITVSYGIRQQWHPTVLGFIRFCPEVVSGFDPDDYAGGSTGRGLEHLSALESSGFPECPTTAKAMICGAIGNEYGNRYFAFRALKIPDPSEIFRNPEKCEIPTEQDKLQFFLTLAATRCETLPNLATAYQFAKRLDRVSRCGFMVDCIRFDKQRHTGRGESPFKQSAIFGQLLAEFPELLI